MNKPKVGNIVYNRKLRLWQGWTGRQHIYTDKLKNWDCVERVDRYRQPIYRTSPGPMVPMGG